MIWRQINYKGNLSITSSITYPSVILIFNVCSSPNACLKTACTLVSLLYNSCVKCILHTFRFIVLRINDCQNFQREYKFQEKYFHLHTNIDLHIYL